MCGALAGSPRRRPCRPDAARPRRGVDAERFGSSGTPAGETRSHLPSSSGRAPPRRSIRRTSSPPLKRSGRSWRRRFGRARRVGSARAGRVVRRNRARAYKAQARFPLSPATCARTPPLVWLDVTRANHEDHPRIDFPAFSRTLSCVWRLHSLWRASLAERVRRAARPPRSRESSARAGEERPRACTRGRRTRDPGGWDASAEVPSFSLGGRDEAAPAGRQQARTDARPPRLRAWR